MLNNLFIKSKICEIHWGNFQQNGKQNTNTLKIIIQKNPSKPQLLEFHKDIKKNKVLFITGLKA